MTWWTYLAPHVPVSNTTQEQPDPPPNYGMIYYRSYGGAWVSGNTATGDWTATSGDQIIYIMGAVWFALMLIVMATSLIHNLCYTKPVEDRRLREIDELIGETQHEWSSAGEASSHDEASNQCSLCLEMYANGDKVLKLHW